MSGQTARIDPHLCDGCGVCVSHCQVGVIDQRDGVAVLTDEGACDGAGTCVAVCENGAISMAPRREEPAEGAYLSCAVDEDVDTMFARRLSVCCRATQCRRLCDRLVKQPGKAGVYCVDIPAGRMVNLYDHLARHDFRCPEHRF